MSKTFSFMIMLGLFSTLLVSCGTSNPSVKVGDLKFYITDVSARDVEVGFSQVTVVLVAENIRKDSVPFPDYSRIPLVGGVTLEGKVGSETYEYGTNAIYQFDSLPPHFRAKYILSFKAAKTASDFKLIIRLYEPANFVENKISEGSIRIKTTGNFSPMDLPVDKEFHSTSLGAPGNWCPNTSLSVDSIQRIDFGLESSQDRYTGFILNVTFLNNSGEILSPFCPNLEATLFANSEITSDQLYMYSSSLDTSPSVKKNGKIFIVFKRFPTNTDTIKSWLSIRRFTLDWSFLGGYKVLEDAQIVYEIPEIPIMLFDEFSPSDFGEDFFRHFQMIP